MIRLKLIYKLLILGVLGSHPENPDAISDQSLYELFQIFEQKILDPTSGSRDNDLDHHGTYTTKKKPGIVSETLGEVSLYESDVPTHYRKYLSYSLRELLVVARLARSGNSGDGSTQQFQYPLPEQWVSLAPASSHAALAALGLRCEARDGFATIEATASASLDSRQIDPRSDVHLDTPDHKYYNFITDKPVIPSCGVFYYEVEVTQQCSAATDMHPLLAATNASLSGNELPHLCVGYVKRWASRSPDTAGDTTSIAQDHGANHDVIDLQKLRHEIIFGQASGQQNWSFLEAKPGDLRSSFALDLSDLHFHNSVKASELVHRTTILSMNRRLSSLLRPNMDELDSGKVDTEVCFGTYKASESKHSKILTSDVVGMGINYIDKSLFITLNGVLIRSISCDELTSNSLSSENLFHDGNAENSTVYPVIGFKLNSFSVNSKYTDEATTLRIKTNLGFRDFQFNINSYVRGYKSQSQRAIDSGILQQAETAWGTEKQLLDLNDNSKLLNSLIKDYLYTEGYIDTFKALEKDLGELDSTTSKQEPDNSIAEEVIEKSHAQRRQTLKLYFAQNQFDQILEMLQSEYLDYFDHKEHLLFEINLYKLVFYLRTYIDKTLNSEKFEFEYSSSLSPSKLFDKALEFAKILQEQYTSEDHVEKIKKVLVLLVVKDSKGYNNLPEMRQLLDKYDDKMLELFDRVNRRILSGLGFKETSNLESIAKQVDDNIENLTLKNWDTKFALVNFTEEQLHV